MRVRARARAGGRASGVDRDVVVGADRISFLAIIIKQVGVRPTWCTPSTGTKLTLM